MASSVPSYFTFVQPTASSGRVATPASLLQMQPVPMRHEANAAASEYEVLRTGCAGHNTAIVVSTAGMSYMAEGAMSVLFKMRTTDNCAFAVKFDKGSTWKDKSARKPVASITSAEIDIMCMAWYMLAARGLSPHVPRVFGVLPFVFDKAAAPYCGAQDRRQESHGVVMELMGGYCGVVTVKALLKEGMAGLLKDDSGVDTFDDTLRVVLFQVLYTIAMWEVATGVGFRHNDLHTANVCLTYWNEERTPVEAEYHLPGPDGSDRVFVLRSPVCATIIDFGYAAVLPRAGGAVFDSRFYYFGDKAEPLSRKMQEPKFLLWGMSHMQPSQHYDVLLFTYAILHEFNMRKSKHPASAEFRRFYSRCFGAIHTVPTHMYQKAACAGRLTPHGQRELMDRKRVVKGVKSFVVMNSGQALMDTYFERFRASAASPQRKVVFGLQPSSAAVAPSLSPAALSRLLSTIILNKLDTNWRPRLSRGGLLMNPPAPGQWSDLIATLDALKAALPLPRALTPKETLAWTGEEEVAAVLSVEEEEEAFVWSDETAPGESLA